MSLIVVAALAVAAIADLRAVADRHRGVTRFGTQSGPLVVAAQRIQTDLEEADASAANAFLAGGIEPAGPRAAYVTSLAAAGSDLSEAAALAGTGDKSIVRLNQQLPVYAGLIEQARAGNRQGYPIGAAYLRDASNLLRTQILPAAVTLAETNVKDLDSGERTATAVGDVLLVLLGLILVVVALGLLQRFLMLRTQRLVNIGLAVATLLSVVAAGVVLARIGSERAAVVAADNHGAAVELDAARAKALAYEAQGDQSQALIAEGSGQSYLADAAAAEKVVTSLRPSDATFTAWVSLADGIAKQDAAGDHSGAVSAALKTGTGSAAVAFSGFTSPLAAELDAGQTRFAADVNAARSHLADLPAAIVFLAVVAALLALWGAQVRINEYR